MKAILLHEQGPAENLKIELIPDLANKNIPDNFVLVMNSAIAVNHIDIHYRNGLYTPTKLPIILGHEGVGYVIKTGNNVDGFQEGDRVIYGTIGSNAYAEKLMVHKDRLLKFPKEINDIQGAALFSKSLTAHYLTKRLSTITKNHTVAIVGATGGTGHVLLQWCKLAGARVVSIVSSHAKAQVAKELGSDHIIIRNKSDWSSDILTITKGLGVNIIYDFVGQTTFLEALKSLSIGGLMVSLGYTSGLISDFSLNLISEKCLFITKPNLNTYKNNKAELLLSGFDTFQTYLNGKINLRVHTYKFDEVVQAHKDMEASILTGSCVLTL